jgi:hypothetical protein
MRQIEDDVGPFGIIDDGTAEIERIEYKEKFGGEWAVEFTNDL